MLGYLSLDIICSSKLTVFLELRSRKTVRFSEEIMSADKYPGIFSPQMKAIDYLFHREIGVDASTRIKIFPFPCACACACVRLRCVKKHKEFATFGQLKHLLQIPGV